MTTYTVHRAQDTDEPVEPATLVIGDPMLGWCQILKGYF